MDSEKAPSGSTKTAAQPRAETAPGNSPSQRRQVGASLVTEAGTTRIAEGVVAKIAGLAAREIPGVYSMGSGLARRAGQVKSMIPGPLTPGDEGAGATQGVSVQVGEEQASVDLELVTWYGQSILDITDAIRQHVIGQVQAMTGLKVVEVNIQVDDIHVEGQSDPDSQPESKVE